MSEREREWKKKKCIYDAVMLKRGLTCGSGFAAVSIAGIIQLYLNENERLFGGGEHKRACRLSSDEYTVVKEISSI